jgi:hypothetical protein
MGIAPHACLQVPQEERLWPHSGLIASAACGVQRLDHGGDEMQGRGSPKEMTDPPTQESGGPGKHTHPLEPPASSSRKLRG